MKYKQAIDKPLVRVINQLNREGFETLFSCSGHEYPDQAYITFKGLLSRRDIKAIEEILDDEVLSSTSYEWRKSYKSRRPFAEENITSVYFTINK